MIFKKIVLWTLEEKPCPVEHMFSLFSSLDFFKGDCLQEAELLEALMCLFKQISITAEDFLNTIWLIVFLVWLI